MGLGEVGGGGSVKWKTKVDSPKEAKQEQTGASLVQKGRDGGRGTGIGDPIAVSVLFPHRIGAVDRRALEALGATVKGKELELKTTIVKGSQIRVRWGQHLDEKG